MTAPGNQTERESWAGTTLAARRAHRRQRLLDVGLELLGTQGSPAVTVRSVCRQARLTDRYFYENFADREAFLLAVFEGVVQEAGAALVTAVASAAPDDESRARAAVDAFVHLLTDDPRKGRVLLLEPLTDPVLGVRGVALTPMFADLIRSQLGPALAQDAAALTATALMGALTNLFVRWLDGSLAVGRAELTEYCVRLLVRAADLAG